MRILVEGILIHQLSLITIFKSFELSSCKSVTVNDDDDDDVYSLFYKGEAGIGKTTFVKKLALDWSNGKVPELLEYHFLFVTSIARRSGRQEPGRADRAAPRGSRCKRGEPKKSDQSNQRKNG